MFVCILRGFAVTAIRSVAGIKTPVFNPRSVFVSQLNLRLFQWRGVCSQISPDCNRGYTDQQSCSSVPVLVSLVFRELLSVL